MAPEQKDKFRQVLDLLGNDEQLALELFVNMAVKHEWITCVFTKTDVGQAFQRVFERKMEQPDWLDFRPHSKRIEQALNLEGWDLIESTILDM